MNLYKIIFGIAASLNLISCGDPSEIVIDPKKIVGTYTGSQVYECDILKIYKDGSYQHIFRNRSGEVKSYKSKWKLWPKEYFTRHEITQTNSVDIKLSDYFSDNSRYDDMPLNISTPTAVNFSISIGFLGVNATEIYLRYNMDEPYDYKRISSDVLENKICY